MVFGPIAQEAAAATSRNLIEMQILRTHPRATDSEIPGVGFDKPFQVILVVRIETHWSTLFILPP